jgi:uncharacterized protein with PIN domain
MGDSETTPPEDDASRCQRCSSELELLTRLPATGDDPAYRIFECTACHVVRWIAEHV